MIVELGVGILAICAVGYTVHLYRRRTRGKREQAEQDKMREKQLKMLKKIKKKFEEEK
ncbi:unnamed protein product [marine sediment metagenome]|uniref:Uncharacterized protein n=1 Tax=marine sediment metagenome TaxID=412755 RepID=X1MBD1_9ZZZZ